MRPPCSTSGPPTGNSLARRAAAAVLLLALAPCACSRAPAPPPGTTVAAPGGDRHGFVLISEGGPVVCIEGHYPSKTRLIIEPLFDVGSRVETRVVDASLAGPIFAVSAGRQALVVAIPLRQAASMRQTPSARALLRLDLADGALRRRYALGDRAVFHDAAEGPEGSLVAWSDADGFAAALAADEPRLSEIRRMASIERPAAARFSKDGRFVGAVLQKAGLSALVVAGTAKGAPAPAVYSVKFAGSLLEPLPDGGWLVESRPENGSYVLEAISASSRRVVAASAQPFASAAVAGNEGFAVSVRRLQMDAWAGRAQLHRFSLSGTGTEWTIPWTDRPTRLAGVAQDGRLVVAVEQGLGGLWLLPSDRAALEAARPALDAALRGANRADRVGWTVVLGLLFLLTFVLVGMKRA